MEMSAEQKAQLQEQKKQCIFCKLISGEMEAKTVFEDDVTIAWTDIYPAVKGHITFLPKEHYFIPAQMPPVEFTHLTSILPDLCGATKDAMATTGIDIFIANGYPAGQQLPHWSVTMLPREKGDGFFNFMFDKRDSVLEGQGKDAIMNIFPQMMTNHFKRNPFSWHSGKGVIPMHLEDVSGTFVYEDEQVLVVIPPQGIVAGHLELYSKVEENDITKLSQEEAFHFFSTASLLSTAVFENLGCHATNIILKSGVSDGNPNGKLVAHVFARMQDDELKYIHWQPTQPKYDLDQVKERIKDKTWKVQYGAVKEEAKVALPSTPGVMKIGATKKKSGNAEDEIRKAINAMTK